MSLEVQRVKEVVQDSYPYLQCPYCLFGSYSMNDFVIVNKSGNISKKMAWCSNCHVTLRRTTLENTGKMDLDQYAKYLASLANWDVNKKVRWQKIFDAMKNLSKDKRDLFWMNYRIEKARLNPEWARLKEAEAYENEHKQAHINKQCSCDLFDENGNTRYDISDPKI